MSSLTLAIEKTIERMAPLESEYLYDPVAWVDDKLGEEVWSLQGDLMEAVADHRHVAVRSAHSTGKSWAGARLVSWWLDVHPIGTAFAVTSAPTQPQVEAVLWREISKAHGKGNLLGRITSGAVPMWKIGNEIIGYGRKPADYGADTERSMQAFQGIHAPALLVILDEACGIPEWLFDAADSLATNESSRVLAIGNPDDPTSHFERICRPGSGWYTMRISAFDTPAFTGEKISDSLAQSLVSKTWVEERARRWGVNSMLYTSKVLAEFPEVSNDTLITPRMVLDAQNNESLSGLDHGAFGCDIARYGDDESVIYRNRGGVIRKVKSFSMTDTMETAGWIARVIDDNKDRAPAVIDVIGLGSGVYDRLHEQGFPVVPFNAAGKPQNNVRFANLRAEMWWEVRKLFEAGLIDLDPADDQLASELLSLKYTVSSSGKVQMVKKEETKKDLGRSPDHADAMMMSLYAGANWTLPRQDPRDKRMKPTGITDDLLTVQW